MKTASTYVFRDAWPYHFDPLFDWISVLPICANSKLLLARLHNGNRTLQRVTNGEIGPFTYPWELTSIASAFHRANSSVTKWREDLEKCGAAAYQTGIWTLYVPEFFRETRIVHYENPKSDFRKVKSDYEKRKPFSLIPAQEEVKKEEIQPFSREARENDHAGESGPPVIKQGLERKAHAMKRELARLHWDNCKVAFNEAVAYSFALSVLNEGYAEADILSCYERALCWGHGHATDCGSVWELGSTVKQARTFLGQINRRFVPYKRDPETARQVREWFESQDAKTTQDGPIPSSPDDMNRRHIE